MPRRPPSGSGGHSSDGPIARADGRDLSVTASFGVAHYSTGQSGDELLRIADDALYRAKEEGKNRVSPASTAA